MSGFELIGCVVNFGAASKVLKVAKKYGIKGALIAAGRGTVHSRILDFFGIYEIRKEVVTMVVERELAAGAIKGISEELEFAKPHHGIAFSIPVSEFTGRKNILNYGTNESNGGGKPVYKIIYTVVDKGKAE
ncbi:MAG: P-II family nitrogen regulator, partial [Oscillospiraceae bacterium]|nr:P-II family nitrogen regulator [Oscillospiraceae bacterium]